MEEQNSHNLENKIMSEIASGKVKLRSRYLFFSEKLGLRSVAILTILLAVLAFTVILFYLVSADSLNYLEFGGWSLEFKIHGFKIEHHFENYPFFG